MTAEEVQKRDECTDATRLRQLGRNVVLLAEAGRVLVCFAAWSIPVIVLKGAAFIDSLYRFDERLLRDIDLLVPPRAFGKAEAALRACGFRWARCRVRPLAARCAHERLYTSPRGGRIDLHRALDEPRRWNIVTEALFERSVAGTVSGAPARLLCPEDTLIHLAVHWAKDACVRGSKSLRDAEHLLAKQPIDWSALSARAEQFAVKGAVWTLCRSAGLRRQVPAFVLRALRPSAAQRLVAGHLTGRTSVSRRHRALLRFALLDGLVHPLHDACATAALLVLDACARRVTPRAGTHPPGG